MPDRVLVENQTQQLTSQIERMSSNINDTMRILREVTTQKTPNSYFSELGLAKKGEPFFWKLFKG